MYAIVQIGSGQYKVSKGDDIFVERINQIKGKSVNFDQVFLLADKDDIKIGQPFLKGVKVSAEILRHFKDEKTVAFKYKRRKHYFKKHGHRRLLTALKIKEISAK